MGPQFCGAIDNDRSIGNEMALNGAELVTNGRGGKRCLKGVSGEFADDGGANKFSAR